MDPTQLSAAASSRAIAAGTLSPVALAEAYLDRIAALDNQLHSFVLVLRDEAIAAAREAECDIRAGRSKGPLHGVPIGLKDIYQTKGIRTTAGSRRYLDHVPDADAETWVRLRNAGMILLGKNETHESRSAGRISRCPSRRRATRGTRRTTRPVRRAAPPPRSAPIYAPAAWGRIPAARSAARPLIAASSG